MHNCCENCGTEFEPEDADQLDNCIICGALVCPACFSRPLIYADGVWLKSGDVSCNYCHVADETSTE